MAARSIASLSLAFGLVSIPVKLYSATESSTAIRFKLMASSGARVKQQYVAEPPPIVEEEPAKKEPAPAPERERAVAGRDTVSTVVAFSSARQASVSRTNYSSNTDIEPIIERSSMLKGYEYEKGRFVLFSPEEIRALQAGSRKTIDIISFIPEKAVDPIYFDKAYLLAPDKRGSKPYNLLLRAMQDTHRCALARWAFRSKEYVVQIRAAGGGLMLQQLFYADEVRSFEGLEIEKTDVGDAELELAKQLIEQISANSYDPTEFVDEEKKRILEAVEKKIAGKQMRTPIPAQSGGRQVIDLLGALRASLVPKKGSSGSAKSATSLAQRKPAKRAPSKPPRAAAGLSKSRPGRR
jgi:DNA end-binding protein Ku